MPYVLATTQQPVQLGTNDEKRNISALSQKERTLAIIDAALAVVENDIDLDEAMCIANTI
jgi:hypothetical protein